MKISSIETLRTEEFANVLWVRVHTDSGVIGLGETFYGAGAVQSHIHDTLAGRLLGRNPLHIEALHREMLNLPMAQSSTGAEYRSASAIDIGLCDAQHQAADSDDGGRQFRLNPSSDSDPRRTGIPLDPGQGRHRRGYGVSSPRSAASSSARFSMNAARACAPSPASRCVSLAFNPASRDCSTIVSDGQAAT